MKLPRGLLVEDLNPPNSTSPPPIQSYGTPQVSSPFTEKWQNLSPKTQGFETGEAFRLNLKEFFDICLSRINI